LSLSGAKQMIYSATEQMIFSAVMKIRA